MLYTVNRSLWGVLATAMLLAPPSVQAITDDAAVELLDRVTELEDEVKNLRDENEKLRDQLTNQPSRKEELDKANAPLKGLNEGSSSSMPTVIDLDKLKPDTAKTDSATTSMTDANKGVTTSSEPLKPTDANILLAPSNVDAAKAVESTATSNNTAETDKGVLNSSTPPATGSSSSSSSATNTSTTPSSSSTTSTTSTTNSSTVTGTISSADAAKPADTSASTTTPAAKVDPNSPDSYYFYGADKSKQPEAVVGTPAPATTEPAKKDAATPANTTATASIEKPVALDASKDTPSDMKAKTDYNEAYKLLVSNSQSAIPAFRAFLVNYPKHELAANAQYWLAEALFAQKDYEGATTEFMRVLREYKDSPKASGAALKLGYSYYELKQWDFARRTLEDTIRFFPDSSSAKLAQARLQRMKDEGH